MIYLKQPYIIVQKSTTTSKPGDTTGVSAGGEDTTPEPTAGADEDTTPDISATAPAGTGDDTTLDPNAPSGVH